MVVTLKPFYGSHTAITITSLNSLAINAYAGSTAVDNSVDLADDVLVSVTIASGPSGVGSTGTVSIYAYGDTDSTPHYTDGVSGTDSVQTVTSPTNLKPLGQGNVVANATTYRIGPFSIANAFNGRLPKKWGIVVLNNSGNALASSGNSADYIPVQDQGV